MGNVLLVRSVLRLPLHFRWRAWNRSIWSLCPSSSRNQHSHPSVHSAPSGRVSRCQRYFSEGFFCLGFFFFFFCISIANYGKLPVCLTLEFQSLTGSSTRLGESLETHFSLPRMQTPLCSASRSQALSKENLVIPPTKWKPENKTKSDSSCCNKIS